MSDALSVPYWRLSGFYFFYFAVVGALIPYWGVYLKSLDYSSQDVGVISAIILATRIVGPNFWGWLADYTQQRLRIIRVGSFLACLIFSGVLLDQRYIWLIFVISCYTFFWHAVLPQFEVITLGYLGKNYHQYSRIRLWGSLGFMAAVVGLGWLFDILPIRYLPVFILSFLVLIWLSSLSLREPKIRAQEKAGQPFRKAITQPVILCFWAASFLLQISHGPYYAFYTLYLVENHHYSSTAAGLFWAFGVLAEVGIFMVMHHFLRRYSLRTLFLIALSVTCVRWVMIGYGAFSMTLLLIAQAFHALSFGVAHAVSIELLRSHFKEAQQGQAQALYSAFSFGAGGAIGALIAAFLWDFSASFTFLLCACAALLALVLCFFWLHPQPKSECGYIH